MTIDLQYICFSLTLLLLLLLHPSITHHPQLFVNFMMNLKSFVSSFKAKLIKPPHDPIRSAKAALWFPAGCRPSSSTMTRRRRRRQHENVAEIESTATSMSDVVVHGKEPFPSPVTPAAAGLFMINRLEEEEEDCSSSSRRRRRRRSEYGNIEVINAYCRSFENYVLEMIVEEGELRDLMDVEEFLDCWSSLNSPVFMDLVCTFYGQLCKDLFSPPGLYSDDQIDTTTNYTSHDQ
ncbi:hypothetical protein Dimus_001979 [Dionaea muscipula]